MIELRSVSKEFPGGRKALDDVSLTFAAGTVTAILGPSGAGKSTLLRCINGLETPTAGGITVNGIEVSPRKLREIRREVGMVFQHFNLVPRLNALTNVLTGSLSRVPMLLSLFYAFPRDEIRRAEHHLASVGLAEHAWQRVDRLSGGQQQRVAIARCLLQQPKVILADEPVASLDPETSREVMQILVRAATENQMALVVNLHQVDIALEFCDRIVGLRHGQVVIDDLAENLTSEKLQSLYGQS